MDNNENLNNSEKKIVNFEVFEPEYFLAIDEKIYRGDVNLTRESRFLKLDTIFESDGNSIFDIGEISDRKYFELYNSIKLMGIITPLVVWKMNDKVEIYDILDGFARAEILRTLYKETGDAKYINVPCVVINPTEINGYYADLIRIDANIGREYGPKMKTKVIIKKFKLLRYLKKKKKEFCCAEVIADMMNMSISSVYNYLSLENLMEEFLNLFDEGKLSLKNAMKLASFSKDFQRQIYEKLDNGANVKNYIIKVIPKDSDLNDKKRNAAMIIIDANIDHPIYSTITIKVRTILVDEIYDKIDKTVASYKLRDMKVHARTDGKRRKHSRKERLGFEKRDKR